MNTISDITAQAIRFIERTTYADLPDEALVIGRRCMVDTVGLYLAGSQEASVRILIEDALAQGGRGDAPLPGAGAKKVPAALAGRVWGTAGHAHDWDDTQVSHDPDHVYGLLTHPSVPPLTAALIVASELGNVDGRDVMLAFQVGLRGRVQDFRMDDAAPLSPRPSYQRHGRHLRRRRRRRQAARPEGRQARSCARIGRELRRRHPRQFRHDDEAAACRPRLRKRHHRRLAGLRAVSRPIRQRSTEPGASSP